MSRTIRGRKGPGAEYWSKRPHNKYGQQPGPVAKRATHRTERQQGKRDARNFES